MAIKLTDSVEDYLKAIYDLTVESGRATTNQLAERQGVAPASVTGMVKKLASAEPPLLEYHKHHGVQLTPEGEKIALEVIRHHRLLELFLQETLGYTWDQVHAEADRLEHVISEDFEERIAQSLGNPLHDPHGEPIPTRELSLPSNSQIRLSQLRPEQQATIERVETSNGDLLRHLSAVGVVPQANVTVVDYSPLDQNLYLKVNANFDPVVLGSRITDCIYVELLPAPRVA